MSVIAFNLKARAFKLTASNHKEAMAFIDRFGVMMEGALVEDGNGGIRVRQLFFHDGTQILIAGKDIIGISDEDLGRLMHP